MLSFDSTIHSNLSVGMPIDFVLYDNDSLALPNGRRIDERDEYFNTIRHQWSDALRRTLVELPKCPDGYWG
jgi:putative proteasome-type protease